MLKFSHNKNKNSNNKNIWKENRKYFELLRYIMF